LGLSTEFGIEGEVDTLLLEEVIESFGRIVKEVDISCGNGRVEARRGWRGSWRGW
jgi:hypothetical protein